MKLRPLPRFSRYQNASNLLMHVDKVEDHVVSSIFHVDHAYDDDAEPWPIVIEAFDGTTHEVCGTGKPSSARVSSFARVSARARALSSRRRVELVGVVLSLSL